uniref:Uncharacterized protein n=1 Tax=Ixodes ricinus TaxID=34613 RepID=A0A147BU23_IXORI
MKWSIFRDFRVVLTFPRIRNDLHFWSLPSQLANSSTTARVHRMQMRQVRQAEHFDECTIPVRGYMEPSLQLTLSMVHPWSLQPPSLSGSFILVETVPRRKMYPWFN